MPRIIITLLIFIALLAGDLRGFGNLGGLVAVATAVEPPTTPILRIETGQHSSGIYGIATDSSGNWMVTASYDRTLRIWNLSSGSLERTIRPPIGYGNEGKLQTVALSPDGSTIACGGSTGLSWDDSASIYLFNTASGKMIGRINTAKFELINRLAFSPDGRHLAVALGQYGILVFRTVDWSLVGEDMEFGERSYVSFSSDGRLVATSYDGYIKLYNIESDSLRLITKTKAPGGNRPRASFSTDGSKLAVGYGDTTNVSVLSSRDLSLLYSPDTTGLKSLKNGGLSNVAWSGNDKILFAGGMYNKEVNGYSDNYVLRWVNGGRGGYNEIKAAEQAITGFAPLADGRLAYGSLDSTIGVLDQNGRRTFSLKSPFPFAGEPDSDNELRLSPEGSSIQLNFTLDGKLPALFNLHNRRISTESSTTLRKPMTSAPGIKVDFEEKYKPKLNGVPLPISEYEQVFAVSIAPNNTFVLASRWYLRCFDKQGKQLWSVVNAGDDSSYTVNVAYDGTVVVVGYLDGTYRWHRMSDGKELLAFFPHADKKRWVLWTPEGFFDHSPGGEELIGFHLNRGKDREAEFIPVSRLYKDFYRPDLVTASFEGKDISEYAKAVDINKLLNTKSLPPKVRITTKASSTDKPESEVTAEICDNGGGVGDVTLYLNNIPIAVESGGRGLKVVSKERDGQCYSFTRNFTLDNGDNVISIMAYNKNNNIESDRPAVTIKHTSRFTGKPNLHILTVAVDRYRDGDLHLKYSNADAKGIAELLESRGKGLFGSITRHILTDGEVTKEKLEETFAGIGKKIRREDMFILFVAGHGITYSKDGGFYFLPVNFRYSQDEDIPKSGVSMNDFKRYLANIQASKSLLLLDTCNSGSFAEAIASRGILEKTAINKLTRAVGRHTIVASSKSQVALEGYQGHGAFSYTLLDGIKGKAANQKGEITVNSLVSYVELTLPELTMKKWGYEQIPQKSLVGEDFAIGAK